MNIESNSIKLTFNGKGKDYFSQFQTILQKNFAICLKSLIYSEKNLQYLLYSLFFDNVYCLIS